MAYTDIISVARAKNYLRIDDTLTADDTEIASMIAGAFQFIERYTNHIMFAKDFTQHGSTKIYKFPVNSVVGSDTLDEYYTHYYQRNHDQCDTVTAPTSVTFNAGYTTVDDIPQDLIQAALQIIKVWYYESEKQVNDTLIPVSVRQVLDTYRTFV